MKNLNPFRGVKHQGTTPLLSVAILAPLSIFSFGSDLFVDKDKLEEFDRIVALDADCSKPYFPDYSKEPIRIPGYARAADGTLTAFHPIAVEKGAYETEERSDIAPGARMDYYTTDDVSVSTLVIPDAVQQCVRIDVNVEGRRLHIRFMETPVTTAGTRPGRSYITHLVGSRSRTASGRRALPQVATLRVRLTQGGRPIPNATVNLQAFMPSGNPVREGFTRAHTHVTRPTLLLAEQVDAFMACLTGPASRTWGMSSSSASGQVCGSQEAASGQAIQRATDPSGVVAVKASAQFRGNVELLQVYTRIANVDRVLHKEVALGHPVPFLAWSSMRLREALPAGRYATPNDVVVTNPNREGERRIPISPVYPFFLELNTAQHPSTHWVDAQHARGMFAAWYNVWKAGAGDRARLGNADSHGIHLNQMNLEFGGEFKVGSQAGDCNYTQNYGSHKTHALGSDFDMPPCWTPSPAGATCKGLSPPRRINDAFAKAHIEDAGFGIVLVHNEMNGGWHWHVRFFTNYTRP